jgi:uncharacterized protein YbcV (DUF1398 family)
MNKQPNAKEQFEKFYNKQLTEQQYKEIKFNLVRYIEFLIVLDKQHQEWHTKQTINNRGVRAVFSSKTSYNLTKEK